MLFSLSALSSHIFPNGKSSIITNAISMEMVELELHSVLFHIPPQWLSVPFAMTNEATKPIGETWGRWKGNLEPMDSLRYADEMLMLILGGVPWQIYFQVSFEFEHSEIGIDFTLEWMKFSI